MKKYLMIPMVLFSMLFVVSCDDDDEAGPSQQTLSLNLSNLANLGSGEVYEGWVIVNGSPVSTGTFTVDDNGTLSQTEFSVSTENLEAATDFVLSIEPSPDPDPAPSAIKLLGGSFSGGSASVSVNHSAALNNDFLSTSGKYILATPTTPSMDDELSGVWFLDPSSGSPMPSLNIPTLPNGWVYEGWVVVDGTPVSTGTFTSASGSDSSGAFSGPNAGPPFPGEDLIMNAPSGLNFPVELTGKTIVVSIEPSPDNSPAPFALKPLVANVPTSITGNPYDLTNQVSSTFPTGTVSR